MTFISILRCVHSNTTVLIELGTFCYRAQKIALQMVFHVASLNKRGRVCPRIKDDWIEEYGFNVDLEPRTAHVTLTERISETTKIACQRLSTRKENIDRENRPDRE
ncbi:hypothetical protein KCU87_g537, partial [Aureobasidium melanogenum]